MNNFLSVEKKREEWIFVVAFAMYMTVLLLEMTVWWYSPTGQTLLIHKITKIIRYGAYAMFIAKFFMGNRYKNKGLVLIFVSVCILSLGYIKADNKKMLLYLFVFIAAIDISAECIIRISIVIQSFVLLLMLFLSQMGIVEDYIKIEMLRTRHYLGFTWTTTGSILFLFIILQYIFLKKGRINLAEYIFILAGGMYFYVMTRTRFAFLMLVVTATFFVIFGKYVEAGKFAKKLGVLFILAPELIALLAILLHVLYNPQNNIMLRLNSLLSNRLILGYEAIQRYGITLFGQPIEWIGFGISEKLKGTYNYVDCSYLQILLEFGIVFLMLVLILYSILIKKALDEERYTLCWIIMVVLLFSVTEPRLLNLIFNPFPLLAGAKLVTYEEKIKFGGLCCE